MPFSAALTRLGQLREGGGGGGGGGGVGPPPPPPGVLISAFGCKTKQYQIFLYSPKSD